MINFKKVEMKLLRRLFIGTKEKFKDNQKKVAVCDKAILILNDGINDIITYEECKAKIEELNKQL